MCDKSMSFDNVQSAPSIVPFFPTVFISFIVSDLISSSVPLVLELVAQGEEMRKELITEKNERLLYTIACKSAVKANMRMSKIEMETLVRNVLRLKNINTCPHGRPIIVTMSKKELEKEFKRIV